MKFPAVLLLFCLGASCLVLSACGQKGPLFLPSEQPEQGSGDKAPGSGKATGSDKASGSEKTSGSEKAAGADKLRFFDQAPAADNEQRPVPTP